MRIIFAGTPEYAVPSLRALVAAGHQIVGVITREDAPVGRKRILTPSPVAALAAELGIPVHRSNRLDGAATTWADSLAPELGVIVAYGGLVREPLLSLPSLGWINLHFSELPRWRGAAPVQRALSAGEQRLGVTVFRLVSALDAGDVLTRDAVEFAPGTAAGAALRELAGFGTAALLAAVTRLDADAAAGEPQIGEATYAHKLSREDGRLDLRRPSDEVLAHWAGVTPEPGAYAMLDGQPIKLRELRPLADPQADDGPRTTAAPAPGTVLLAGKRAILHLTDGALEVASVQTSGKAAMDGASWLRGRDGSAVLS